MNKKQSNIFLHLLYKKLRNGKLKVNFVKLDPHRGEVLNDYDGINLDPRKEILATLIHEFYHIRHPYIKEKLVVRREKEILKHLSERQLKTLFKLLAAVIR